ncbi:MAG TPA: GGDEF domain-containing protein [Candidatus Angelobacter sp.]|nr:GGDEF domain-containing protein [Candidatus Angelobacter sp.]
MPADSTKGLKNLPVARIKTGLIRVLDTRTLLPVAFLLMLAFLVAMAWDGYSSANELLAAQAYVQRTHQVLHEMDGMEDGLQDAREARLHYILTPEQQDLLDFEEAEVRVWTQMDRVTQMDPEHKASLNDLRGLIREELRQLRTDMRVLHTKLVYHSQETDEKRNRVMSAIDDFKNNEERLLRERNQAAENRAAQITRSTFLRILAFSLLMGVLFFLVMRDSKKLRVAEQKALFAQTRLEGSLLQLQSETENSRLLNELQADFQICVSAREAYKVAATYLHKLIPGSGGSVYALYGSEDRIETVSVWPETDEPFISGTYSTEDCCAVRGGRLHSHLDSPRGLACRHFHGPTPPAYICFPLSALGETLGILHVHAANASLFTASRLTLIQQIGEYAALRLANLKLKEKLQDQSIRDPLTGLYNRRFLETTLEQQLRNFSEAQDGIGIGIVMADIDGFKLFNDTFGHEAGDHVLREIGSLLRRCVRSEDIVCRYGGEEFLAVIPESSPESVCERAELMRNAISKLELEHAGRPLGKITASFGISFAQNNEISSDTLLRRADEALYVAKRSGCDCVRVCESVAALLSQGKEDKEMPAVRPRPTAAAKRA